ncbi:MAG: hypothetical protein R3F14_36200, partial [Polyangiaceae bacterium]
MFDQKSMVSVLRFSVVPALLVIGGAGSGCADLIGWDDVKLGGAGGGAGGDGPQGVCFSYDDGEIHAGEMKAPVEGGGGTT